MRVWALALFGAALLISCARENVTPALTSAGALLRTPMGKTDAWGVLVDDPSGKPLAGVPVRLEPWDRGCVKTSPHTARCPGYLKWHDTTKRNGRFEVVGVPNGDYLLVIGSDSAADLARPTIHDHIVLTGGMQRLLAPKLPTIPCNQQNFVEWCQGVRPSPDVTAYPRPAPERDGEYRLTTISRVREQPCTIAFDAERVSHHLPLVIVDEWLTENAREINEYRITRGASLPQPVPWLTSGQSGAAGDNSCKEFMQITYQFAAAWTQDPRERWFAATWYRFDGPQASGGAEFPLDPRVKRDRGVGPWP